MSKKIIPKTSSGMENDAFASALGKIASANSASSRVAIEASKATKPSRHTRFVYSPAKGREPSR